MSSSSLSRQRLLHLAALVIGAGLIFVLPWLVPVTRRVVSDSYNLGFNNMVAILGLGATLLLMIALRWRAATSKDLPLFIDNLEIGFLNARDIRLAAAVSFVAVLIVWLAWLRLPVHYYSEIRSFIPSTELILLGRAPYTQFHWNYGPLFLYVPIAIVRISGGAIGVDGAYIATLMACTAIGLMLLAYTTTVLPGNRRALFFLLACVPFVFNISMGLNYTALRFAAPYAALLWLHRIAQSRTKSGSAPAITPTIAWKLGLAFAGGAIFCFAISPESGIAFFLCAVMYLAFLARSQSRRAGVLLMDSMAAGLVCSAVFFAVVSRDYLASVLGFGSGGGNFPIVPSPYILFYVGSLLLVLPALAVYGLRNRGPLAALACSWALLALVFAAPSLGRSDPGHVFCNGLGVFLGGFWLLNTIAARQLRWYQSVFALLFSAILPLIPIDQSAGPLGAVWQEYERGERKCDRRFWQPAPPQSRDLEKRFEAFLKPYARIGTPLGCDEKMEIFLKRTGRYVPEFFAPSAHNPITENQVARKLAEIGTMPLILVPIAAIERPGLQENQSQHEKWRGEFLSRLLLFPIDYHWRNQPLFAEAEAAIFVRRNFSIVAQMDSYFIMKRSTKITSRNN